jgi:hypothetical protein
VTETLIKIATAIAFPLFCAGTWQLIDTLLRWRPHRFISGWIAAAIGGCIAGLVGRDWRWLTGSAISLAIALVLWWWRKNRDQVKALAGNKAKAIREAMVRKQRQATRRRPVLLPQGGGF